MEAGVYVQASFVPQTFDLMSLDNNCCKDRNGNLLPYYLPWPTLNSSGVNVFPQPLPFKHNVSVFLLLSRQVLCSGFSFINTRVLPLPLSFLIYAQAHYWWAILQARAVDFFCSTNRVIQTRRGGSVLSRLRLSIPGNLSTIFLLAFNLPKQQ